MVEVGQLTGGVLVALGKGGEFSSSGVNRVGVLKGMFEGVNEVGDGSIRFVGVTNLLKHITLEAEHDI